MMKSWADHCSSDEEDSVHDSELLQEEEDAMLAEQTANKLDLQEEPVVPDEVVSQGEGEHQQDNQPRPITDYDFPMNPPFTAFIGNLSYNIKEVPQLIEAVSDLAKDRLGQNINVIGGRIAYHRTGEPGKHRGFGYVEVETLDEVSSSNASSVKCKKYLFFVKLNILLLAFRDPFTVENVDETQRWAVYDCWP
jgi:hypothetical protein